MKRRVVSEVFRKDMQPEIETPYESRATYLSNTVCPECKAVFLAGNWRWGRPDAQQPVSEKKCPACRQIQDDYAGGELTVSGGFVSTHRDEILNRVRNVERTAKQEHPLQRIMRIDENEGTIVIRATSGHLVARMGKALKSDFDGDLDLFFGAEEKFARANWRRDS
jgi:phage FluMu protein Com